MKNLLLLILLTFSCSVISQENKPIINGNNETVYPLSKDELKRVYDRDVQCAKDLTNALTAVDELHKIVTDLNNDVQTATTELKRLQSERLILEATKDEMVESLHKIQMKRTKRFGVGLQTGYGIDGKIYVGTGLTYNLFQF